MRAASLLAMATLGATGGWAVFLSDTAKKTAHPSRLQTVKDHTAFPTRARVRAARRYVAGRRGRVSFALIDSRGRAYGFAPNRTYVSASVVKAMLLVAYLRVIGPRAPSRAERALLGPMIVRSSNSAATSVYGRVGDAALCALATRAGMNHFSIAGYWASARIAAADQARFFWHLNRLLPRPSRAYARRLLASIVPRQRWGFSRLAAPAGFETIFKGGWRPTASGYLAHEVARFERGGQRFSMAVLSDGNPSYAYGTATLRGVAERIFGLHTTSKAAPVPIPSSTENLSADIPPPVPPFGGSPVRATRALIRWAKRNHRADLIGTYIASRSRHNEGVAVDLTLVHKQNGRLLPMGSAYDELTPRSHTLNATGRALRNRLTLQHAMRRFGYQPYAREWWHFEHRHASGPALDIPLGCG